MCGLQAFVGKNKKQVDLNKFKKLMLWNALGRGTDATGIFSPENKVIKDSERCDIFLSKNQIKPDNFMMGHVRASTYGGNTKNNAHPFQAGNITLMHNGTLTNPWGWARTHDVSTTNIYVDSDVICHILNKTQDFNTLGELPGAAALLIHSAATPNILYVYRNKERELFYGFTKEGIYVSSIKASLESIGCIDVTEFSTEVLYQIENGEIKKQTPIVSKPYTYTNPITSTNYTSNKNDYSKYIGSWLYCDSDNVKSDPGTSITIGNFYKCIGVTNELVEYPAFKTDRHYIYIIDNNKKKVKIDFYNFDNEFSKPEINDYVISLGDLNYTTKDSTGKELEQKVISKDEILKITEIDDLNKKFTVHNGSKEWIISKSSVRKLTDDELISADNYLNITVLDNKISGITDPMNNKYQNSTTDNTKENKKDEDNEDEDEDDNDFSVIVDARELIDNDFAYVLETLDKINKILDGNGAKTLSHTDLFDIKQYLSDMYNHTQGCMEGYTDIALEQGVLFYETTNY